VSRRVSPSLIIAVAAFVLSCTGGAVAAGYITGSSVKDGSLTGKDIRNHSLSKADFRGSLRGPRGFDGVDGSAGPAGPAGPQGPAGPAGTSSATRVVSAHQTLAPGGYTSAMRATCPAGMVVVGTGFNTGIGNADFVLSYGTFVGAFIDNDTSITIEAWVQAICAPGADGGGASSLTRGGDRTASSPQRAFEADEAAARAGRR